MISICLISKISGQCFLFIASVQQNPLGAIRVYGDLKFWKHSCGCSFYLKVIFFDKFIGESQRRGTTKIARVEETSIHSDNLCLISPIFMDFDTYKYVFFPSICLTHSLLYSYKYNQHCKSTEFKGENMQKQHFVEFFFKGSNARLQVIHFYVSSPKAVHL